MNKQLIIVGIIVILITVGLSGCTNEDTNKASVLSVDEVLVDRLKYDGKEIEVEGYIEINDVGVGGFILYKLYDSSGTNYIDLDNSVDDTTQPTQIVYEGIKNLDHVSVKGIFHVSEYNDWMDDIDIKLLE